jgi:hypothetical protein
MKIEGVATFRRRRGTLSASIVQWLFSGRP